MKYALLLLTLFAGGLIAKAQTQQIPIWNGGFEDWDTLRNNTVSPRNWTTIDTLLTGYQTVTRSTDAYSGKYAAKVISRRDNFPIARPSALVLGVAYLKLSSLRHDNFYSGQPFTYIPKYLTFYYKFVSNNATNDAVEIRLDCKKGNTTDPWLEAILYTADTTLGPSSTYRKAQISLKHISLEAPDTLLIGVYYYSRDTNIAPSGYLLIDDIHTEGDLLQVHPTSNREMLEIYPNPAQNFVTISGVPIGAAYEITDLTGKMLLKGRIQNNGIEVRSLITGMYFLRISNRESSWVKKLQIHR